MGEGGPVLAQAGTRRQPAPAVPQAAPVGFELHAYEKEFTVAVARERAWGWLEDPATFVEGQVWPYRVEFVTPDRNPPGFHVGGLNIHHGPFLHLPGTLTEIREGEYRDLRYFYGSYVFSPRLLRPTRLQFWLRDDEGRPAATRMKLRLDSYTRPAFGRLWTAGQRVFWSRFPRWLERSCA